MPRDNLRHPLFEGSRSGLIPDVYERLRAAAKFHFERQRPGQTLQATALVHEAFLKLAASSDGVKWESRAHFLALASRVMRQILIDIARAKSTQKRGGSWARVSLEDAEHAASEQSIDLLALAESLDELERLSPVQARIVEMHFLGGMTFEEIAEELKMPLREARNEWYMARAWLHSRLAEGDRP